MQKNVPDYSSAHRPISDSRWWIGVIVVCCISLTLLLRLIQLQVIEGGIWAGRATQNRLYGALTTPGRAVAFDRYGEPLILNVPDYFELLDRTALFGPSRLLTADQGLALLASDSAAVQQRFHRMYPLGPALAHVLGYVTAVTTEELLAEDRAVSMLDQTGKQGLEQSYDRQLRGAPGEEQYEISALGIKLRLIKKTEASAGAPIQTTLDPFLSAVSYQALGDNQGAVVIADAATGDILSLVSGPAFDPNLLTMRSPDQASESARRQAVQALFDDKRQLFFNRAVSGAYPPGSIFKLVTALAALQSGNVTAATEFVDEGVLRVGDFSYANWYFTQYGGTEGAIAIQRAIARSNDIFFYKAAEAAGPNLIAAMAQSLGFGQPVGLELRAEHPGLVPNPRWKEAMRGERWFLGNTYHYGIGQGDLLATPIQVAQMMQAISNAGTKCPLHLVKSGVQNCENIGLNNNHLELVLQGMLDACSEGGTAYPFFAWNTQHISSATRGNERIQAGQVACKTGTSEFGNTDERGYKKTHSWFAMTVGTKALIATQLDADGTSGVTDTQRATTELTELSDEVAASATATIRTRELLFYLEKSHWLELLNTTQFPETVVIVVLVESDESRPYREGSRDAAPVALQILDWMAQ